MGTLACRKMLLRAIFLEFHVILGRTRGMVGDFSSLDRRGLRNVDYI
jgi:hypothetical protein